MVSRNVSQLTPSTQVLSLAELPPVAVPAHVPVNGGTGPVGAIVPDRGFAAATLRTERFDQTSATINAQAMKAIMINWYPGRKLWSVRSLRDKAFIRSPPLSCGHTCGESSLMRLACARGPEVFEEGVICEPHPITEAVAKNLNYPLRNLRQIPNGRRNQIAAKRSASHDLC